MGRIKISKYTPSIFQGKLDLSAARAVSVASEYRYEQTLLKALLAAIGMLSALYIYFVCASVLNVVARREAAADTQKLQTAIAAMEQEYFALSHSVDGAVASTLGLTQIAETEYVYTPGSTAAAVTMGGNGI